MRAGEMGEMWLRDQAKTLRRKAARARKAYTAGPLYIMCQLVADSYEAAAFRLDEGATSIAADVGARAAREEP